ncbi:MAG: NAD(P)/FAD-dependent oxidoreductase [Opitutaceae bacterium]
MGTPNNSGACDVVVIGGALSGAATALLLRRRNPKLRVTILEKSPQFSRRVGESTVEISAHFLGRVLGLTEYLNENHLVKQGMRFWFANDQTKTLTDCSETGPAYNVRFPGYQVDRARLDEEVLRLAVAEGAQLMRPVQVREVELNDGGQQRVAWEEGDGNIGELRPRWVIDASGFAALLARKNGWLRPNHEHPIAACWSRWKGVKSFDAREFAARDPEYSRRCKAVRFTATNHITGEGWWAWFIPLKGGDTSVGIVFDQRLTDLPPGGKLGDRLKTFMDAHPGGRELLESATYTEGDVHFRRNCAYCADRFAGNGFALVGDAAAFMDPFYSPGMDWISFTTYATAVLVDGCMRGRPAAERVARHNERFRTCYRSWFEGLYKDKYYYMGDHELMTLAFRLDLGLYYLGVVSQVFRFGDAGLEIPPFARPYSRPAAIVLRLYNRRFAAMARSRRARGVWGRKNKGCYDSFISYQLDNRLLPRVLWALACWLGLEVREGWRTWFKFASEQEAGEQRSKVESRRSEVGVGASSAS